MKYFITISVLFLLMYFVSFSKHAYVSNIPNGAVKNCIACHPQGNYSLNPFGKETKNFKSGNVIVWSSELASLDSDNDGFSNGVELQDIDGTWIQGNPDPGNSTLVTNPGDSLDHPTTSSINEILQLSGLEIISLSPNPSIGNIYFNFNIHEDGYLTIDLFGLDSKYIMEINHSYLTNGIHNITLQNLEKLASGNYFLRIKFNNFIIFRKILLIK